MRNMRKILQGTLALLLAASGALALATPAYAACGDTTAEWVDPILGSAWSGTIDSDSLTVVLSSALNAAVTVVVSDSGAGTWVHDYDTRWTASAAGLWTYHFEITPSSCSGGKVTAAAGAATDDLYVQHSVSLSRTL